MKTRGEGVKDPLCRVLPGGGARGKGGVGSGRGQPSAQEGKEAGPAGGRSILLQR